MEKQKVNFNISKELFWTILSTLIMASFFLGTYIGQTKFDKEKSDYYEQTKSLLNENKKLKLINDSLIRNCLAQNYTRPGIVKITYPSHDGMVSNQGAIKGTYDINITEDIWVIIWPDQAPGRGWPISDNELQGTPSKKENNIWRNETVNYGGPAQGYKIVVCTASPSASVFISNKIKNWARNSNFTGLMRNELPTGLVARDSIRVAKN